MEEEEEEVKFDEGIPIPEPVRTNKYNFDKMEVGQSKFWPSAAASKAVVGYARKSGRKFVTRRVEETIDGKPVKGTRVWRTE